MDNFVLAKINSNVNSSLYPLARMTFFVEFVVLFWMKEKPIRAFVALNPGSVKTTSPSSRIADSPSIPQSGKQPKLVPVFLRTTPGESWARPCALRVSLRSFPQEAKSRNCDLGYIKNSGTNFKPESDAQLSR
jgi:hypothetical protein